MSIKLRDKLYFSFSIPTPGFPHFYYMLGANLRLLLYGVVSVMFVESFLKHYNGKKTLIFGSQRYIKKFASFAKKKKKTHSFH